MPDIKGNETNSKEAPKDSFHTAPPAISLPKGGGAIRGMGEKFAANPVTGTGSMSVPIATSSGQNDGGLFELNFRDERYLPFEGQGAESAWQFSLPTEFKAFDYNTIADLVLHVRYTARDGDAEYTTSVASNLAAALNAIPTGGLKLLVSVRHDFPAEWRALQAEGDDARREIRIDASLFPYFVRGNFSITAVHTIASDLAVDPPIFSDRAATATFEISRSMEYLLVSYSVSRTVVRSTNPRYRTKEKF